MEYHTFSAMSTTILAGAQGEPGAVAEGFRKMEALVRKHEQRFTRFSPDSELSPLNRSSGQWLEVSQELYEVLFLARRYYLETDGLFDPAVLPDLERAGYDRSIEQVTLGLPQGQEFWEVGLEDPFNPEHDLAILQVGPGAIATSSVITRRWQQGRQQRHHLIDPRSSEPAHSPWASVTVITHSAAAAEVLAKALLIRGANGADALMARHAASAFIAVDLHGKLWGSDHSQEYLYKSY